jgi:hypothetical protein
MKTMPSGNPGGRLLVGKLLFLPSRTMCEIPLSVGLERIHWGRFDETVSAEIYGLNLIMFVIMTSYLQNALKPRFVVAILRVFYLLS